MNNLSNAEWAKEPNIVNRNRVKLIVLFSVALVPLLLASLMYFGKFAIPSSTTNKGALIWPPVTLSSIGDKADNGQDNALMKLVLKTKKWTIMMTGNSVCDAYCLESLHTIRQVNIALGKEAGRVSRLLVSSLNEVDLEPLRKDYPNLLIQAANSSAIKNFQQAAKSNGAKIDTLNAEPWMVWVVDPLGNIILQYTPQHDGYDMIYDLKRVLKLSNIG